MSMPHCWRRLWLMKNLIDLKRRLGFRPMLFWLLPSCDTRGTSDFHRSCSPQRHGHIYTAREDVEGVAEHRMHEHGRRAELGVVAAAGQLDGEHPGRTGVQYPVVLHQILQQLCQKQRELNMAAIQGSLQSVLGSKDFIHLMFYLLLVTSQLHRQQAETDNTTS